MHLQNNGIGNGERMSRGSRPGRCRRVLFRISSLLLLTTAGLIGGCDSSVNPIIGSDLPFTIWGFMNSEADTQYVRVFPISGELITERGEEIDARVFSTNMTTGERRQWSYETVHFDSLSIGHVFLSPFRAEHEHRYRLEVIRSDGEMSSVQVTVPSRVDFEIDMDGTFVYPVRITGDIPNLVAPRVKYEAINIPPAGGRVFPPVVHSVVVPYDGVARPIDGGWRLDINMVLDTAAVYTEFRGACLINSYNPDVWLRSMEFTAVVGDSTWAPPGGVFDPDILAVPGMMSNVENGYGFFGAGQEIRHHWTPSVDSRLLAGYRFEPRCTPLNPTEACEHPPIPCIGERVLDIWQLFLG